MHGFDASLLKLLHSGVVLDDTKTLEDYKIQDESVIIMMNSKFKPKNVQQSSNSSQPKAEEKKPEEKKPEEKKPEEKKSEEKFTQQLNSLTEMGFERTQAEAAIKAARGQIDLAIEYLYSGIPEGIKDMDLDNVQEQEEGENEGNDGGQDDDPVKNVASIAKIICQRDPSGLTSLLQNIQQNDPDLMNLIKQREEEFKTFLEQPITNEDYRVLQRFSQELGLGGLGGEHSHEAGSGSGRGQNYLHFFLLCYLGNYFLL